MSSSIIVWNQKLSGENYVTPKNTILIVDDLQSVLTEQCPSTPAHTASQVVMNAYGR